MSDQVSNKRQSFVKKKKIERYSTRFYSGRSFPLYAPAIHTERIQMKFAFQMDSPPLRCTHKVHFPRMYLARLPFELRDGISSIYIYTYTRNKSLAPFMTFLHRSIDRLYRAPIYRESHSLTFRMKRHIPWSEWYYGVGNESTRSGGENLLFTLSAWNESNKTNFLIGWK